jgi:hypothetical protein
MGSSCSVCVSPFREAVERGLSEGANKSEMSNRFQLPRRQLYRHFEKHMDGAVPVVEVVSDDLVLTVIPRLERLIVEVEDVKDRAIDGGKDQLALQAVRIQRELLNDVARLRGEIPIQRTIRLDEVPGWAVVLDALDAYPRARLDVARALRESA